MKTTTRALFISLALAAPLITGQVPNPPSATITNGILKANVYLPNPDTGYYRGPRFDWSGVVSRLEYKGHNFFGVWFPHYDPQLNDAITGPVEEFRSGASTFGSALGFDEAKPGELFVKIGVGVLRRLDDKPYSFFRPYPIVNTGTWSTRPSPSAIQFEQVLKDDSGYAYDYTKTLQLVKKKPELLLEHRLKNTGKRTIDTDVYDHDFYMLDAQPTGPPARVVFTFKPEFANEPTWSNASNMAGKAHIDGNQIVYDRQLEQGEQAASLLKGFSAEVADNDIKVENPKAGIGVEEIGDHPIVRLNYWSIRSTMCPEAFIHLHIEPGKEARWKIRYRFYEVAR